MNIFRLHIWLECGCTDADMQMQKYRCNVVQMPNIFRASKRGCMRADSKWSATDFKTLEDPSCIEAHSWRHAVTVVMFFPMATSTAHSWKHVCYSWKQCATCQCRVPCISALLILSTFCNHSCIEAHLIVSYNCNTEFKYISSWQTWTWLLCNQADIITINVCFAYSTKP